MKTEHERHLATLAWNRLWEQLCHLLGEYGSPQEMLSKVERLRAEVETLRALAKDAQRGLRVAYQLTLETQTVEEACSELVRICREARQQRDDYRHERDELLAELEGLLCYEPVQRVAPDKLERCRAVVAKSKGAQ